ncbi:hypothetical protein EYZ11_005778 [Aspergillus tanneri]|uniref:Uncharacterized protein n=1 Tax=Aspergillus tanneri TaxID=1220188 RepID=A0A4S3JH43_9EURO|nr:hypothetical protein EYZ11_005778 [Aspergillus tanneri]
MGAPVFAIGLWWFVWTVPSLIQMHWMVPTASLVLVDYALNKFDTVFCGAVPASVAVGVFPLFTRQMYDALGNNVAGSVLATLATGFVIVPVYFIWFGERIRGVSRFAR